MKLGAKWCFSRFQFSRDLNEKSREGSSDYYQSLGVSKDADQDEIKRAYKRKALRTHPEKNRGPFNANYWIFSEISEAYQILSNPESRRKYDQVLEKEKSKEGNQAQKRSQGQSAKDDSSKQKQGSQQNVGESSQNQEKFSHQPENIPGISQSKEGLDQSSHPHRYFFTELGIEPYRSLDLFNSFYTRGLLDDEDLEFFDFRDRNVGHFGGHTTDFFGVDDMKRELGKGKDSFAASKTVFKKTVYQDGKRKTITYTKKVDADGKVDEQAKEEIEDEKGDKSVRYIDDANEIFKEQDHHGDARQIGSEKSEGQRVQSESSSGRKGESQQSDSKQSDRQSQQSKSDESSRSKQQTKSSSKGDQGQSSDRNSQGLDTKESAQQKKNGSSGKQ